MTEEFGVAGWERAEAFVHVYAGDRLAEDGEDRFGVSPECPRSSWTAPTEQVHESVEQRELADSTLVGLYQH
ncbi:hypothetical protein F7R91_25020 [Streptomyces luteolifulvus]|uniref:Uncharacterized protein n=1 Tax=Streptomyces luteolifulvus TaxID=2615112 RepID=A0A6H9UWE1_9ACTN|nr:hypothetical protein [Streptomyces luteolifulvus]KAB1143447.1 hypothetical protein F7R91_25020 [Streptomyces luteolifulvus]